MWTNKLGDYNYLGYFIVDDFINAYLIKNLNSLHNSKDVFSWNYTNMNTCKNFVYII